MATANSFGLLGDCENGDLSSLITAQQMKLASNKPAVPSKPLPLTQTVRVVRNNEGSARGGPGRSRGGRGAGIGQDRDVENGNYNRYAGVRGSLSPESGEAANPTERERSSSGQNTRRDGYARSGGDGGFDSERPQRRVYERRSGTGTGNEMKRDGAGRGNWGTITDDVFAQGTDESLGIEERDAVSDKQVGVDTVKGADVSRDKKEELSTEPEKESEDNEMTLEEYEKVREEKKKALSYMKPEERKVEIDKDLQSMQQLSLKKGNDSVFIKLNPDKDTLKLRDNTEKEERVKKAMNIAEFLKPAKGEKYYTPSGRGRGRGGRALFSGYTGGALISPDVPAIEDKGQFPTLGAK